MAEFGPEWRKKVIHWAKVMGMERDGEVTRKDFERQADRYIELCKLEGAHAKDIRGKFLKTWDDFYGEEGERMILENFPDVVQKRGMEKLRLSAQQYARLAFDVIDLNGDGVIQQTEFQNFYKAMNIDDEYSAECFKALDTNKDGVLSRDEFVGANVHYLTQNESTSPSNMLWGPIKD